MMKKPALILAATGLLSACAYWPVGETEIEPLPRLSLQQDAPMMAWAEHVLDVHFDRHDVPPTVCLGVSDGRSDEALPREDEVALMERFPRLAPLVRCSLVDGRWTDDDTGEVATLMSLHSFTCASDASCTGWASMTEGATGDMATRYVMEWDGGQWRFESSPRLIAE